MRSLALAVAGIILLAGCSTGQPVDGTGAEGVRERVVTVSDGRTVVCLSWKRGYAGGFSCDWENAR